MSTAYETDQHVDPAARLEVDFTACRVAFSPWWSNNKGLTPEQRKAAASCFGAEKLKGGSVSLLDPKSKAWKRISKIRSQARTYWTEGSLPYPEDGLRLIRRADVAMMRQRLDGFAAAIPEAIDDLNTARWELMEWGRLNNGDLYNSADYPSDWDGLFKMEVGFPTVTPPDYLRELDPEAYERERIRAMARFEEAVVLAEQAFTDELAKMVSHLAEVLTGTRDGKPVQFKESSVQNLKDFFQRFGTLSVRSNDQLDELVERARSLVQGVSANDLQSYDVLRQHVGQRMGEIQGHLETLLEARPRRKVIRRAK